MNTKKNDRHYVMVLAFLPLAAVALLVYVENNKAAAGGRSFVDTFLGFDRDRWRISHGWSNGPHQDCTWYNGNVKLKGGSVNLLLKDERSSERPFTCAEIQSTEFYGYGTYEVRMRSASAPGLVTAFFTYTGPGQDPAYPHDEIDFEFLGKDPRSVELNYFAEGKKNGHGAIVKLGYDASATTNDYAFEWLPNRIRWFVNGRLVHEAKRTSGEPFPSQAGKIMLSIWNGAGSNMEGWLDRFVYPGKPLIATIEYVSFTEAGRPCLFESSIVCKEETSAGPPR